jgi:ribosomal protein S18 acetylase RimI-like enzyme
VIGEARKKRYQKMRLDTIESMKAAKSLYFSLGFKTIEAYCHNPLENPSFMELDL